jgi:hypothetical protein
MRRTWIGHVIFVRRQPAHNKGAWQRAGGERSDFVFRPDVVEWRDFDCTDLSGGSPLRRPHHGAHRFALGLRVVALACQSGTMSLFVSLLLFSSFFFSRCTLPPPRMPSLTDRRVSSRKMRSGSSSSASIALTVHKTTSPKQNKQQSHMLACDRSSPSKAQVKLFFFFFFFFFFFLFVGGSRLTQPKKKRHVAEILFSIQ